MKCTLAAFRDFSIKFEGNVPHMYLDVKGLVTIGIGCLIDPEPLALPLPFRVIRTQELATPDQIRCEWRMMKSNQYLAARGHTEAANLRRLSLPFRAVDDLLAKRVDQNEAILRAAFPDWDDWPSNCQLGAMSMAWAMGAGFVKSFPKWSLAARTHNWLQCADECKINEAKNPGIAKRNKANRQLFASCVGMP